MRFLRSGPAGAERPAVLDADGTAYDLTPLTRDIDGAFLAGDGVARARAALADGALPRLRLDGMRVGAPIARPGKVVCIGLNYSDHAAETAAPLPADALPTPQQRILHEVGQQLRSIPEGGCVAKGAARRDVRGVDCNLLGFG